METENTSMKTSVCDEYTRIKNMLFELYPTRKKNISEDEFYAHSVYTLHDIKTRFGSFKYLVDEVKSLGKNEAITRKNINIYKNDQKEKYPRSYVVTSAIAGAALSQDLLETFITLCNDKKAQLVVLPMRGIHAADAEFDEDILQLSDYFCTEYQFNDNLKAQDFMLNPQMINPLTGITRFGQKHTSLIVAAPKQFLKPTPVGASTTPHIVHCTGTITLPDYAKTRQGALAAQDHVFGGLLVEIRDKKTFHIRQLTANAEFGVYDLDKYYKGNKITKSKASGFIMGDMHCGSEDPSAIKAWKECINLTQPKYVVMHDILDCKTINHHQKKNIAYRAKLPVHMQNLEQELNLVGTTLQKWTKDFPKTEFVITKGNHDAWLDTFLEEGSYAHMEHFNNHIVSLDLAKDLLTGINPLEGYVNKKFKLNGLKWLDIDSDFKIEGIQCGSHGAMGSNGARPSINSIELQYGNSCTGHSHAPTILRKTWVAGTSTYLKLDYNKGGGSSWLHGSILIHPGGIRQMIISINGQWKL